MKVRTTPGAVDFGLTLDSLAFPAQTGIDSAAMKTLLLILALVLSVFAQQPVAPVNLEYGTIQDIKSLSKIFVRSDDDDARSTIVKMLSGYEGVQVVNNTKSAELFLDYTTLTRDVAANRGPYARGASMALKSQMRVFITKPDGTTVIAWTETETFDVTNGLVMGASNEVNLTHHFVRDLQKARGEKPYSMRKLFKGKK